MTQDETWNAKYNEVITFIETHKRNPSRYDAAERGAYLNWIKHNKKLFVSGKMRPLRVEWFEELMKLMEEFKRKNQYE